MPRVTRARAAARTMLLALACTVVAAGADAQPRQHHTPDVRAAIDRATAGLELSAAQQADMNRIASRYADRSGEPGVLWRVADEIRTVLTPAQVERLQQRPRQERRRGDEARAGRRRDGQRADRPRGRRGEGRMERPDGERREHMTNRGVAEQHREAARGMAARHREQMQQLREQRESGAIDDAAFAERAHALREQVRSDIDPLLTEEARRMRAEMTELRDRMRSVRDDVLRLNAEQRAAMEGRAGRGRERGDAPLSALSADQRSTMNIYRALVRGAHGQGHGERRVRTTDR